MIGLVKRKKRKVKPGYKKKIQWAVDEKRRKTKRAESRARGRQSVKLNVKHFNSNCWSTGAPTFYL